MRKEWAIPLVVALIVAWGANARAYINPRFTPKDLVRDSDSILVLELKNPDAQGKAIGTVKKVLKGNGKDKEVTFDLLAMPEPMQAQGKAVIEAIVEGNRDALLFVGRYQAEGTGMEGGGEKITGLLHVGGKWSILERADNGTWEMDKIDEKMLGTFSGSTDMLLRCVTYVLTDPDADVPVAERVDWGEKISLGKTSRRINRVAAVDLVGDGKLAAFLASEAGDQIFRWNGKTMENLTARLALESKSVTFAWGDFNRDGRLDLASWNGKQLRIHWQKADGTFAAVDVRSGGALKDGCLSLSILDIGQNGRPGLLVGTKSGPVILTLKDDGTATGKSLAEGEFPGKDLGAAGPCVVSDFDGDSLPDVIQICSKGGLFYRGQALGAFAPPVRNQVGFGQGRHAVCLGDYDHDGLPDILVVLADAVPFFYQNLGGGNFSNVLPRSGSFEYISKPGGIHCQTIDINNDGRQDIFVAYDAGPAPQIFFNRGFRCFGLSRRLESQAQESLPQASEGQQAGCVADFTGHNAMDMLIVLGNGEVWLVPRQVDEPALAVVATLSTSSPCAGPVVVTAFDQNKRSLGAWMVSAGEPGAFFGMVEKGTLTLKWRWPGGSVQKKQVVVGDKAVRVVLDKGN